MADKSEKKKKKTPPRSKSGLAKSTRSATAASQAYESGPTVRADDLAHLASPERLPSGSKRKGSREVSYAPASPAKKRPETYHSKFLAGMDKYDKLRQQKKAAYEKAKASRRADDDDDDDNDDDDDEEGDDEASNPPQVNLSDDSVKDPHFDEEDDDIGDDDEEEEEEEERDARKSRRRGKKADNDSDISSDDEVPGQGHSQKMMKLPPSVGRTPIKEKKKKRVGTPTRKRTSPVWAYFKDCPADPDGFVICQFVDPVTKVACDGRIKKKDHSTSGLLKHLHQHPSAYAEVNRMKGKQLVQTALGTKDVISSQMELYQAEDEAKTILGKSPSVKKMPKTNTLQNYYESQPSLVKYQPQSELQKRIDLAFMTLIARCNLPISIVDHPGFHEFIATVHNRAVVKSSATFRKRVCPLLYKNVNGAITEFLIKTLADCLGAAMTADHWTSRAYDNFQSMTLHFIDKDFVLHKVVTEITPFPYSHHAKYIERVLDEQIERIPGRHEKLSLVAVTDSAACMLKSTKDAKNIDEHVRCIAHLINNACEQGFKETISGVVDKCKKLAAATHKSAKTCTLIKTFCQETSTDYVKIVQPVKTRWNSMAMTMKSVLRLKDALQRIATQGDRDSDIVKNLSKAVPTNQQFLTLEALVPVLETIKEMSERLTSDTRPSIHLVMMVLVTFQALKTDNAGANSFLKVFKAYLEERAQNCGRENSIWRIGQFLHPKLKGSLLFVWDSDTEAVDNTFFELTKADIIERVRRQIPEPEEDDTTTPPVTQPVQLERSVSDSKWQAIDSHLLLLGKAGHGRAEDKEVPVNNIEKQIEFFLHKIAQPLEVDGDILAFYRAHEASIPDLARFARSILCIPASSASSERLFSAAGKIISDQRTNISASRAQELIYINQNYTKALPFIKSWDIGLPKKSRKKSEEGKTGKVAEPHPGTSSQALQDKDPISEFEDDKESDWNYSDVDPDFSAKSNSEEDSRGHSPDLNPDDV